MLQATPTSSSEDGGYVAGDADAPVSVTTDQDDQCLFCAQLDESDGEAVASAGASTGRGTACGGRLPAAGRRAAPTLRQG